MNIRKDDIVEVITGDDAGTPARTTGRVLRVLPDKDKVVVEGINRVYKHLKPNRRNPQGGRLSKEMPIAVSNVLLVLPDLPARRPHRPPLHGRRPQGTLLQEVRQRPGLSEQGPRDVCAKSSSDLLVDPLGARMPPTRRDRRVDVSDRVIEVGHGPVAGTLSRKRSCRSWQRSSAARTG